MRTAILAVTVAMGVAGVAAAQQFGPPGGENGPMGGRPVDMERMLLGRVINNAKVAQDLGLSAEQIQTLRDGLYEIQTRKVELRADLEVAGLKQARLLTADAIDEKALMDAVEHTGDVRTEIAKAEMGALLLVHKTLNAEQREKVRQMMHRRVVAQNEEKRGGDPRREQNRPERGRRANPPSPDAPPAPPAPEAPTPDAPVPPPAE